MDIVSVGGTRTRKRKGFNCEQCGSNSSAGLGTERVEARLCRECFGKRHYTRRRQLNDFAGSEWAQASRSVEEYPDTRSEKQRIHGACFPLSLARQQIEIYTRRGETVLDPFVGVGTTLDACAELGRIGTGIELNPRFATLAKEDLLSREGGAGQRVIQGDALHMAEWIEPGSINMILTSPPYGSLLKNLTGDFADRWHEHNDLTTISQPKPYSEAPEDLGNMEYTEYLGALGKAMVGTREALAPNSYAVWVVKDFRALKEGIPYVNLHGDVITAAERSGLQLWDVRIYNQTRFRPLVCLGFPSRNFYLNIGHSYLLVFKRP